MTDHQIVIEVLNGNIDLFDKIVRRYSQQLVDLTKTLIVSEVNLTQDIAKKTLIWAYRNLASYDSSISFSNWLYRKLLQGVAKENPEKFWSFKDAIESEELTGVQINWSAPDLERLKLLLPYLKMKDRQTLALFYFQNQTIDELSEIFKINYSEVLKKLTQAKSKIAKLAITSSYG